MLISTFSVFISIGVLNISISAIAVFGGITVAIVVMLDLKLFRFVHPFGLSLIPLPSSKRIFIKVVEGEGGGVTLHLQKQKSC